ncbi:MAG: hypothetical protein JWM80_1173 [Cyanobacteria bacterium RYN_339]|nr:hypothetical protein [Cyanobacteria bacterium RYN_339]
MTAHAFGSRRFRFAGGLVFAACLLAGCRLGGGTPISVDTLHTPSGFLQLQSTSGLSLVANFGTLAVHLIQPADPNDANSLPAPLPAFAQVYVTAASSSVADAVITNSLAADQIDARGRSALPILSRLPPSSDFTVRIYLTDKDGRIVASGEVDHTAIRPGSNNLDIPMIADAQAPFLIGASDSINVSDNVIVKGATLAVSTGVTKAAPGVARVEVQITGEAYGDGKEVAQVASLTAPALDQFQWRPVNPSGEFVPTKLVAGNTKAGFMLTSRAYDPFDHLVGTGLLKLSVIGTASVDVGVDASGSAAPVATPTPTPTSTPAP